MLTRSIKQIARGPRGDLNNLALRSGLPFGCSDITNKQVGISGVTVPEGGNLHIYYVQSCHLVSGSNILGLVCHTTLLPC